MTLLETIRYAASRKSSLDRDQKLLTDAAAELERLTRQLAEARAERESVEQKIRSLYDVALRRGDDAAIGLSHALDIISPPREGEPSAALQTDEKL